MAPRKLYSLLLPFLIMVYIPKINAETSDDVKNLLNQIFTTDTYNKAVRPTSDQGTPTDVDIDFHLTGIIEFDSQKEKLTTSGYLIISWNDYYLTWDPTKYGGMLGTFIPQDNVWKPDIALQNGVSEVKGLGSSNLFVYVTSDGSVYWWPYGILQSTCSIDITYFPFDIQTCALKFVAWSYTKAEVSVTEGNKGIILDEYEENSAWSIVDTSVDTLQESGDAAVVFSIKLKRKPLFFLLNVILPVILLSLLNVCIFVLPAESGEKASFSVTVFLALAVFLTIVTATLPQNSEKISFLGIYLVLMAGFSTLIVILTLFQLRLNFRDVDVDPIPSWLIKLQVIVEVVRCRRCNKVHPATHSQDEVSVFGSGNKTSTDDTTSVTTNSKPPTLVEQPKATWNHICNAFDFVFFWIFFIATVCTTVTIFVICSRNASRTF